MSISEALKVKLESFMSIADFRNGSVVLDLDGTALSEEEGKVFISGSVERAAGEIAALGRPIILNTLRFPMSIIQFVAKEWIRATRGRIPVVLLKGSLIGYIEERGGEIEFVEIAGFPISAPRIEEVLLGLAELLDNDIRDLVLFYYPRDWRKGEMLWTPDDHKVGEISGKFQTATTVFSCSQDDLRDRLFSEEICMLFLLVNSPRDTLMAYQHKDPSSFFTQPGVDKSSGTKVIATHLGVSLPDSVGAGDTRMDNYLGDMGLAVMVGREDLPWSGLRSTVSVRDPQELGELLSALADLERRKGQ